MALVLGTVEVAGSKWEVELMNHCAPEPTSGLSDAHGGAGGGYFTVSEAPPPDQSPIVLGTVCPRNERPFLPRFLFRQDKRVKEKGKMSCLWLRGSLVEEVQ